MRLSPPVRWLVHGVSLLVVLLAMKAGYDFGAQLSGWVLGAVIAANAGLFCALMIGALTERITAAPPDAA